MCNSSSFEVTPCAPTQNSLQDRQCRACSACGAEEYELRACSENQTSSPPIQSAHPFLTGASTIAQPPLATHNAPPAQPAPPAPTRSFRAAITGTTGSACRATNATQDGSTRPHLARGLPTACAACAPLARRESTLSRTAPQPRTASVARARRGGSSQTATRTRSVRPATSATQDSTRPRHALLPQTPSVFPVRPESTRSATGPDA